MDTFTLCLAILATLAVILIGLIFLKSRSPTEEPKSTRRRVAAVPNRDEDGQIIQAGPGPRGRRGAGPRMRRRQVQEEPEPEPEVVDNAENSDFSDDENSEKTAKLPAKMGKKKLEKMQAKADRKIQLGMFVLTKIFVF